MEYSSAKLQTTPIGLNFRIWLLRFMMVNIIGLNLA